MPKTKTEIPVKTQVMQKLFEFSQRKDLHRIQLIDCYATGLRDGSDLTIDAIEQARKERKETTVGNQKSAKTTEQD